MFKTASLFAALALTAAPALAETVVPAPISFEKDGHRYTYTVRDNKDYRLIEGVDETSRVPFTLFVGKHSVWGKVNGFDVNFSLRSVKISSDPVLSLAN